jgi:hypothetical protein
VANPYAPPRDAEEDDEPRTARRRSAQFYRVATSTVALLQFVTFGLYAVYWFYKHWAVQKRARRLNISPVARGIFGVFFVFRLFKLIDTTARASGVSPNWNHGSQASLYFVVVFSSRILQNLSSGGLVLVVALAANAVSILPLVAAQRVANLANGRTLQTDESLEEQPGEDEQDDD